MPEPVHDLAAAAAALFGALAHPVRVTVLEVLTNEGPLTAGALQERLRVEASLLSHHLKLLRDAHLVATEAQGRHRLYRIDDLHVAQIVGQALGHVAHSR